MRVINWCISVGESTTTSVTIKEEKSLYFGISHKATWLRAQQFCLSIGMNLLTVDSREKNDAILKYLNGEGLHIEIR